MSNHKILKYAALVVLLFGIGICIYLTQHHYSLLYGMRDSKSFCSVNSHFDCDSVNISSFSEIGGIPVALVGAFTFAVELLFLLGTMILAEDEKPKAARMFFYLASINVAFCVYLGLISSLYLKIMCLYCISVYVMCGFLFFCAYKIRPKEKLNLKTMVTDLKSMASVILLAVIPLGSFVVHASMKDGISKDLDVAVDRAISDWSQNKKYDFQVDDAPSVGTSHPKLKLIIFSDFECPHCMHAAPSLHAFVTAHKDVVQLVYQNYPLDSSCNPKGGMHKDACMLARTAICAYKLGRFQNVHDWIFEHQGMLGESSTNDLITANHLDPKIMDVCMKSLETDKTLSDQIARGNMADIQGTPSIFANGKLLPLGWIIPVLEKALDIASSSSSASSN